MSTDLKPDRLEAICPACKADIHRHPAFDTSEDDDDMPFVCTSRCPKCGEWLTMAVVERVVRTKRYGVARAAPLHDDQFAGEPGAYGGDSDDE